MGRRVSRNMTQGTTHFAPPLPSTGLRTISFRSKGSCRTEIVARPPQLPTGVRLQCESRLEDRVATVLLAEAPLADLRDQYPHVDYVGLDGTRTSHTFDFLAVLSCGKRIAIAVKPYDLALRHNLAATLSRIDVALPGRVANRIALITDRDFNKVRAMNASRFLDFQNHPDPEADSWLRVNHDALPNSATIGAIIEKSGLGGRMFRAAFRAIYRGPFTADLTQPISYHTTVTKEEAVQ